MSQTAYRFAAQVGAAGKLEVTVPVPPGTPVEVVVLAPPGEEFAGLVEAARSSLDFWDNPRTTRIGIMPRQGENYLAP
jgi:hypothetical protein